MMSLSDSTFKELRAIIYDNSGIYISDSKKYLITNRLTRILQENKLDSFDDYLRLIKISSNGNQLTRLFDAITTNETYFFREPHQLSVFTDQLFPELLKEKKGSKPVKIWSAACSSGEEPYTISMMLLKNRKESSDYEIHASDLSTGVLDSAKNAVFNSYSVRNIPEHYMKKHFTGGGQSFALNSDIRKSVKFTNGNLFNGNYLNSIQRMDVIFCRNVLIYFDAKAKQAAVSNLYDRLNPEGYLIIGTSESLHNVTKAFRPTVINKVIFYQKV